MRITFEISMDNAAFEDCNGGELARLLRKQADRVDGANFTDDDKWSLFDANGNKVGTATIDA